MRVKIELEALFRSPFSIGAGVLGGAAVAKPLLKDARQVPYIPGSTLKGLLRHEAEKIARALWGDEAVCRPPNPATMCPQGRPEDSPYCPICRIFGSPWRPGPLIFSDLKPTDEHGCELSKGTELRFGVGISRYREVAAEELLYTFELAPAAEAVPFRGTIEGEIPNGEGVWSVALILAALRVLSAVGGAKSRGIGWVSLNAVSVEPEVPNVKEVLEKCPMSLSVLKSA